MAERVPFHPDPAILAELELEARIAEAFDVTAGYQPRRWTCQCGAAHARGHFPYVGSHRCMRCGYVGEGGSLLESSVGGQHD